MMGTQNLLFTKKNVQELLMHTSIYKNMGFSNLKARSNSTGLRNQKLMQLYVKFNKSIHLLYTNYTFYVNFTSRCRG